MPKYPQETTLTTIITRILDRLENLERANPFANAAVTEPGMQVQGAAYIKSQDFDGDLDSMTPGANGWALGGAQSGMVINKLALRGGIIGNDALANPVTFDQVGGYAGGLAFSTTFYETHITRTLTVPGGFTRALILCNALAGGLNPASSPDNLRCQIDVVGIGAGSSFAPQGVPAGLSVVVPQFYNVLATGLTPGGTITINGNAWTQVAGWPAASDNFVTINVVAIYLR